MFVLKVFKLYILHSASSMAIKPYVTNEISRPYHLISSTFRFRGIRSNFSFLFHFSVRFLYSITSDETPRSVASHLKKKLKKKKKKKNMQRSGTEAIRTQISPQNQNGK